MNQDEPRNDQAGAAGQDGVPRGAERGKVREEAREDAREDGRRTPGDGTLAGAVPAGLSVEELRRRAEDPNLPTDAGTG